MKSTSLIWRLGRRSFLRLGAAAAFVPSLALAGDRRPTGRANRVPVVRDRIPSPELESKSIAELQAEMEAGELSAVDLVDMYLSRIEAIDSGPGRLNSVLEVNPDARAIARDLDAERDASGPRGPLHGIPILVEDRLDTHDRMGTTAGSLALLGDPAPDDSTSLARLRRAGAILLGKAGLSEWANFRGFESSSGWSGRGGQVRNPYVLDRNPCGSSAGTASATSAGLCAAGVGAETDGSIVCPGSACGVVGIKPTVGLTSRAGVVPTAGSLDTVGSHGRTVADAAAMLGAMTGVDPRDPVTQESDGRFFIDYTQFLDPEGLAGARIGVAREGLTGFSSDADAIFEDAVRAMSDAGATVVDPANIPTIVDIESSDVELTTLIFEFKRDLNAYLATRTGVPIATLADAIAFNIEHGEHELLYFGQEWFELAEAEIFSSQEYEDARAEMRRLGGADGIDAVMDGLSLDALVAPTGSPAWPTDLVNGDHFLGGSSTPAAMAGYPLVTVPAGSSFGLPVGITFMGRAWSEPVLIRLASGFEAATEARTAPTLLSTVELVGPPNGQPHSLRSPIASRAPQGERLARARLSAMRRRQLA